MSVMAPVSTAASRREQQQLDALRRANAIRIAAAGVKRDVAAGRITLAEALTDPRAGSLRVVDLMIAQRGVGRKRAVRRLRPEQISETRRVRDLTDRQRQALARAFAR